MTATANDALPARRDERARTALEVGGAFAGATAAAAVLYHLQSIPFVLNNLHALVAVIFLVLPQILLRERGDIERYGFTSRPRALGLAVAGVAIAVILPLFVVGFAGLNRWLCAHHPALVAGRCLHVLHAALRWPPEMASPWGAVEHVAAQVIVVALPEELFFRGYLQGRLEDAWRPTHKLLGAPVGGAWVVSALLFGLGHYLVSFEPQMLSRVFPGLAFGWMFARTRSILAGTIFHAACNVLMEVLVASYLT